MSKPSNEKAIRTGLLIGGALLVYSIFGKKRPGTYVFNPPSITVPPTITVQEARILADVIQGALYADTISHGWPFGSLTEDEATVVAAMTSEQLENDADVLVVVDQYGVHGEFLTPDYTLPQAIRAYLSTDDIEEIHNVYRERGISIRF